MKKWWFISILVLLVGVIAVPIAWAQNETAQAPFNTSKVELTESQKKELEDLYSKMSELKKQIIDKYVEFGAIDQERADRMKQKIEQMEKFRAEDGYAPGMGVRRSKSGFGRKRGAGFNGQCPFNQQTTQSTQQTSQTE